MIAAGRYLVEFAALVAGLAGVTALTVLAYAVLAS